MPYLNLNDYRIYYQDPASERQGKKAILFCHGAGGSSDNWRFQLEKLKENYRPIAVDLPEHGKSEGKAKDSVSEYREIIYQITNSLELPPFFLAGHSMGGAITMDYALTYPQDLQGIVLVGTGAKLKVLPTILETYRSGEYFTDLAKYSYGEKADAELIAYGEQKYQETPPHVFAEDFTACDNFNIMDKVKGIQPPAQIIVGTEDVMTPPKYSHFLHENLPHAELTLIDKAGHMVMEEAPDEVNRAIESFIEKIEEQTG